MKIRHIAPDLLNCLVFHSPDRINWKETENNVVHWLAARFPDARPSELAMTTSQQFTYLRNFARRWGTRRCFDVLQDYRTPEV